MSQEAAPSTKTATTAPAERSLGDEFAQLGSTTATRGWVALTAVVILLAGFLVWGIFGRISVQTTLEATVTNGSLPSVVSSPVDGYIVQGETEGRTVPAGQPVAVVRPYDGSADVPVTAPFDFVPASYSVLPGSPVKQGTILARGSAMTTSGKAPGTIAAIAFVPFDFVGTLEDAVGVTLTNSAPGTSGSPVPVKLALVDTAPSTEERIAQITGNALYAHEIYTASGGAPYMAVFTYDDDTAPAPSALGGQPGVLAVTEWSMSPLAVLFGR